MNPRSFEFLDTTSWLRRAIPQRMTAAYVYHEQTSQPLLIVLLASSAVKAV